MRGLQLVSRGPVPSRAQTVHATLKELRAATLWVLAVSPATALARVDYNLTTNVVVDGEPNGPYTLTFTAQQNAAEGTQWPADSVMHLDFNNIVTFSSQDIVVSSGVTVTEQNSYYFLISGYNYSANAGQPLTVTINNVALNPNSTTVQNASGAQNLDLLSLGFSYINNKQGTDVHFSQATVPMIGVGQQGPKPQWNGKVVSWAAVDGATSYEIRYSSKGDDNYTTEEVTDTSKDLTSFVNQYGANDYGFYVYAKRGALQNQIPGYSSKTWHSVKVTPAARKIGNNYYSVGTNGGAVVGELVSGDTVDAFGEPDQNGAISGLFAEGDVIKLTANPEEGYDFEKWTNYIDYVEESWQSTERTDNPFQFEVKKDQTAMYGQLVQQDVPAQDLAVVLQLGDAHATLAASEALKQALQNCGFSSVTTQGSTINMTTPNKDGAYIVEVSDVQQSVRSAIYQATQMGEDAGERVFGIGLQSIENYGSYEDYTKEQQKEGRKPLKDGKEFHVLWSKPTSEVEISVVAPTCGTEVTAEPSGEPGDEYDAWTQSPRPSVSVTTNNAEVTSDPYAGQGAYWMVPSEQNPYGSLFVGTFEGGSTYRAFLMLQPAFGFYFTKELNVTSSDGSPINVFAEDGIMVQTTVQVAVDVRVEHDWGDWSVTKPATVEEEGVETRVCKGNAEHKETRPIKKLDPISGDDCAMEPIANKTYTGKAIVPSSIVIKDNKGNVLVKGTDYDLEPLKNNVNVGTVTVKATLKGIYTGSVTGSYKILPAKITSAKGAAKTYNGKTQKTTWTVKAKKLNVPSSGFLVSNYKANKNAGTAKATITGSGNFTGTVTGTFTIKPAKVTAVTAKAKVAYTGKATKPTLVVKAGRAKVPASGYTATWSNNTKVGTATVRVSGKGNYKGSAKTTFRIVAPTVTYRGHMQTTGWEKSWERNGQLCGTTGKSRRLEGMYVKLAGGCPIGGGIRYKAKVQGRGWEAWKKNGQLCGTTGQGRYLEAICIELTGNMKAAYSVYYRVHVQNFGWLGWAKNGVTVGTAGYKDRIEAIQIVLVPKGGKAPATTYKGASQWVPKSFVKK